MLVILGIVAVLGGIAVGVYRNREQLREIVAKIVEPKYK